MSLFHDARSFYFVLILPVLFYFMLGVVLGRLEEGFSECPYLTSRLGLAAVYGLQGAAPLALAGCLLRRVLWLPSTSVHAPPRVVRRCHVCSMWHARCGTC